MNAFEKVAGKFRSGNSVPIDRAVIKADEWREMVAERDALAARVERLERSLVMSAIVGDSLYGALLSMLSDDPDEGQAEAAIGQWLDHERPDELRFVLARVRAEAINDARRCIAIVSHAREGAGYVDGMVDADTQWNGKLKAYAQSLIDESESKGNE